MSPTTVDPRVTTFTSVNLAINPAPASGPKGRLFVMLPGTGGPPRGYRLIVREGAARGYHTIGLSYPNASTIDDLCAPSTDPDCAEKVRREIVTGADESPLVAVDAANSIVGRLTAFLSYLNQTAPNEGWGAFLINGAPDWSRITMAGHSQGAGHAAFMGKLYNLNGVAMFSGPGDLGLGGRSLARWVSFPSVTPTARIYGFIHRDDPLVPLALALAEWRALGLDAYGPSADVDGVTPYTGGSHELTTTVAPNPAGSTPGSPPAHGAPVVDPVTPLTATGTPQFASIWDYMAFP